MEYWKSLLQRYSKILKENGSEDSAHYQLIANDIDGSVQTLLEREEYEDAKLLKILSDSQVFNDPLETYKPVAPLVDPKTTALAASAEKLPKATLEELQAIVHKEAEQFFSAGEGVLSACARLAVNDIEGAITQLIRANELFLAFAVCKILKSDKIDEVCQLLGLRAERLGLPDCAAKYYSNCKNKSIISFFAARNELDYAKYNLKPKSHYEAQARAGGSIETIVANSVLSGKYEDACAVASEHILKVMADKKYEKAGDAVKLLSILQNISIGSVGAA